MPENVQLKTAQDIGVHESPKSFQLYHIYHSINPNYVGVPHEAQPRKYVGYVEANSIEDAYIKAQNASNPNYRAYNQRDTVIGDLIQDHYGFYMVCADEFKLVCLVDAEGGE